MVFLRMVFVDSFSEKTKNYPEIFPKKTEGRLAPVVGKRLIL